jgi:hypothetical protein
MPSLTPAVTATGSLVAVAAVDGSGLYCSETLACSDVDVVCTDTDGIGMATTSTGTLVPA